MASTFGFFSDVGLTVPLTRLSVTQFADGGHAVDSVVYLGSNTPSKLLQEASAPGLNEVTVQAADADTAHGIAASSIKLATTKAGLDDAVGGNTLGIGAIIQSGAANAVTIHVRATTPALPPSVYSDISLTTCDVVEVDAV